MKQKVRISTNEIELLSKKIECRYKNYGSN